ncbi:MAG TPA: squalene/phytoene synthase family protein [Phototrophicaceae bacterium]|nr:squalene/phytoene synthase family protein [Phototrophicaceae bacterium]
MSLQIPQAWEYQLLGRAEEAFRTQVPHVKLATDSTLLEAAYHHCDTVTRFHSRTFYLASDLLPEPKRRGARALYAFCRVTDNIVDRDTDKIKRLQALGEWRDLISMEYPPDNELIALAWADTRQCFHIPHGYAEQLIDGVARDLTQTRYTTFGELADYAYGVASTVGLMAMHIVGFAGEPALPYAVKLGVALQMTNILRDVADDWRNGRLYLPLDELAAYGLSEADIADGQVTASWRDFMRFQIERNRTLYDESSPGISLLDRDGRFAIAAAARLYRAILRDIEYHDYNVFSRRAHTGLIEKMLRLPLIWWNTRRAENLV